MANIVLGAAYKGGREDEQQRSPNRIGRIWKLLPQDIFAGAHHIDILLWPWKERIESVDVMAALTRYEFSGEQIGEEGRDVSADNVEKSVDILLKLNLRRPSEVIAANYSGVYAGPSNWVREEIRVGFEGRDPGEPEDRETVCLDRVGFNEEIPQPADVAWYCRQGRRAVRIEGAGGGNDRPLKDLLDCLEWGKGNSDSSPGKDQILTIGVIQAAYLSAITGTRQRFEYRQLIRGWRSPHDAIFPMSG